MASNAGTEITTSYGKFTVAGAIALRSRLRGIGAYLSVVETQDYEAETEPQENLGIFQSMGQQLRFWQDIEVKVSLIKNEISRLDEEINSILNYIEDTTYNVAQGYKVYKVLRDKQIERKALVKEVVCLESILANVDTQQLVKAFQNSIMMSDEKIKAANKITFVKELMEDALGQ